MSTITLCRPVSSGKLHIKLYASLETQVSQMEKPSFQNLLVEIDTKINNEELEVL